MLDSYILAAPPASSTSMYLDANNPDFRHSKITCDIAIVGAGPAGITLAQQFKNSAFKVCLLESGGFEPNKNAQQLSTGSLNSPSAAVEANYVAQHSQRLFGGTGSVWGGYCREMDALDFEQRDLPFAHAWPITKADLQPYYRWEALQGRHDTVRITDSELDIKYYEKLIYPFHTIHRDEFAKDKNIHVIVNATVQDVILHSTQSVAHLNVVNTGSHSVKTGTSFQVIAKVYIFACGGIGNVKLLLNAEGVAKKGIGNVHDQVGRHFMEHPHFQFYTPPALLWLADREAKWLYRDERYKPAFYLQEEKIRDEKLLNFCAMISAPFDKDSQFSGSKMYKPNFAGLSDKPGAFYSMAFRCEQRSNPDSRVTLSNEKDALGLYRTQLDWKLTEEDKISLQRSIHLLVEELGKASLGRVRLMLDENNFWGNMVGGGHLMGTTRMSDKADEGVVDRDCKCHGMDNLYLAGSSVFATSGVSNPTLTIMALSRRLAAHLQDKLRDA
jgi:choline dehydrogenase-like flavoprotein